MNEGRNLHKSALSLAAISLHFYRLSLGSDGRSGISDSNIFYAIRCNYVRTPQTIVRKRKLQNSTYKETLNGLIWGHLDERMELLGHLLKAIVPLGINLAEFDRTKLDHIYKRKLSWPKSSKRTGSIFLTAKRFQYVRFGRNRPPKRGVYNGCRLRSYVRSVAHDICYLNVISKLSTIDKIALGAKYHLNCLAVLVNCTRQHNNGKVTSKKK